MTPGSTTFRVGYLSEDVRRSLLKSGAVGDLLFISSTATGGWSITG